MIKSRGTKFEGGGYPPLKFGTSDYRHLVAKKVLGAFYPLLGFAHPKCYIPQDSSRRDLSIAIIKMGGPIFEEGGLSGGKVELAQIYNLFRTFIFEKNVRLNIGFETGLN